MQVIAARTADAEAKQKAAQEKEATLNVESAAIAVDKADAEQALSEAIPALEDAAAALNDLKRDDITEIRSFAKPHVLVQRVRPWIAARVRALSACSWSACLHMHMPRCMSSTCCCCSLLLLLLLCTGLRVRGHLAQPQGCVVDRGKEHDGRARISQVTGGL